MYSQIYNVITNFDKKEIEYWLIKSNNKEKDKIIQQINKRLSISQKNKMKNIYVDAISNSGVNLIITNLPMYQDQTRITKELVYNTMIDYGEIFDIHLFNNTVYVWFVYTKDAENAHHTINNMQVENNIINTYYYKTNHVSTKFDWTTFKHYKVFSNNDITYKI